VVVSDEVVEWWSGRVVKWVESGGVMQQWV
jgi:hypothetical protein